MYLKKTMKQGDIVKSNLPYPRNRHIGIILEVRPLAGDGECADVYWDNDSICGTMTKYLEVVCR